MSHGFDSIPTAVKSFASGEFVIVLDSPWRENEGDLIISAEDFTPEKAAFMIRFTSGYLCAPMAESRAEELDLPLMVESSQDPLRTAYTVTVDYQGTATGISAANRSRTCRALADPKVGKAEFRRPGHVVPLRARQGGVRTRQGHTEAAVELCRLAGKQPVAVIAELVADSVPVEGKAELEAVDMMQRDDCISFAKRFGLKICTIEDLVAYLDGSAAVTANGDVQSS
ncbi:3,4-dihydroxy-2-butanone 4-phosphate synthase [Piedraia hortae CBS 480.64]|uniref:3,4-dihydroxy-2-butanone 4-phosphate synthase n=1 Tax=Piedraia hortae CBS 480.64 TaxID=1314780 RepID=A0A6A7BZ65_9PEZI|nr:3,4-dihydroxy-2-butanone 4-phosphate synthase [Piedraia hortae CBS 480.64]